MTVSRKTILILEDEGLIAMALEDLIRDLGFAPIVCGTIDNAINAIEAGEIDLAILDYKIRNQTSEPVALALRHRSIPFLVCSGLVTNNLTEAFEGARHLGKPYNDGEMQAAILAAFA